MIIRPYRLCQLKVDDFALAGYSVAGEESLVIAPETRLHIRHRQVPSRGAQHQPRAALARPRGPRGGDHVLFRPAGFPGHRRRHGPCAGKPGRTAGGPSFSLGAGGRPHPAAPVRGHDRRPGLRDSSRPLGPGVFGPARAGFGRLQRHRRAEQAQGRVSRPGGAGDRGVKNKGVEITNRVEFPLAAYLGDTGKANYSHLPFVANARALLLECTFFDPEHVSRAGPASTCTWSICPRCLRA